MLSGRKVLSSRKELSGREDLSGREELSLPQRAEPRRVVMRSTLGGRGVKKGSSTAGTAIELRSRRQERGGGVLFFKNHRVFGPNAERGVVAVLPRGWAPAQP